MIGSLKILARRSAIAGLCTVGLCSISSAQVIFEGIGDLDGGTFNSIAYGVSADGSVIVGVSNSSNGNEAFRWQNGSMVGLGDLPFGSFNSVAFGVSADGTTVVGRGASLFGSEGFRWTSGSGIFGMGDLGGGVFRSVATGISADSGVITGDGSPILASLQAFQWTSSQGMVALGGLAGALVPYSEGLAVSPDGRTIVGTAQGSDKQQAFRWTAQSGMESLGNLPGGNYGYDYANAVSADGNVIVGNAASANGTGEAFRWTPQTGMVPLGDLQRGPFKSSGLGVSADGNTIVGYGTTLAGEEAMMWDLDNGMQSLRLILIRYGVDMLKWTPRRATAISGDGSTIVGFTDDPNGKTQAFRVVLPAAVVAAPSSFSITRGTLAGGGLSDLAASDDRRMNILSDIAADAHIASAQLVIQGTSPVSAPRWLHFQLEAAANIAGLTQTIELYNYASGSWVAMDSRATTQSDSTTLVRVTQGRPEFIESGTRHMQARISFKGNGIVQSSYWNALIDQAVWMVQS